MCDGDDDTHDDGDDNADARGNSDEGLLTLFVTSDAPLNVSLVVQILVHGRMDEDKINYSGRRLVKITGECSSEVRKQRAALRFPQCLEM